MTKLISKESSRGAAGFARTRLPFADELTEQAVEGVVVVQKGRILYCNPAFARMARRPVAKIQNLTVHRFFSIAHPEDRARIRGYYTARLRGRPAPTDYYCRILRPDQRVIWLHSYAGPILCNGYPALRLCAIDVTEQKQAEEAYRTLVEMSPHGIVIFQNRRIAFANPAYCRLSGYTTEELLAFRAMGFIRLIHPRDRRAVLRRQRERTEDLGPGRRFSARLVRKNGEAVWVGVHAVRILHNGKSAMQVMITDISESRQLEAELFQSGIKERKRIGQDIHDTIGQQLAGARYLSQALGQRLQQNGVDGAREAELVSATLGKTMEQVRNLCRGLIPFSISEEGLANALQRLAGQTTRLFSTPCRLICPKAVAIEDEILATHLYRIAQEAVNNAMRHSKASLVTIRLSAGRSGGHLTISDNGKGLVQKPSAEHGSGLRIMRHRAEAIEGALAIQSTAAGTTVICTFPLPPPESEQSTRRAKKSSRAERL